MYPQKSADIFKIYINKHLPENHRLHKIFSRNSVKVIYSCTKSMKTTINNHNKNILGTKPAISTTTFINCRNKKACPLNRQHQIGEVVYEGTLSSNQPNHKEKKFELQNNVSDDAFTTATYLSETSFPKTTRNFLWKSR